ncbi:ATP-binding protein [Clostridium chromiireducens]|uniref:ATPase AAA-type core domain-containing protein n=1 Tax=Clostridium chromiireducens TaxID=225345 RepID=A0A1V4ILR6_9CLOT|nr:ATP-binding protein [Clostridium chromiireducens]OPJ60417.1 hypothetical protein CLCHR_29030 [Clostridium chromiireducens]
MKINWVEFESKKTKLKIERTYFNDLSLMVGVSGAGKSQILKAVSLIYTIVREKNINNRLRFMENSEYKISFEIDNVNYEYEAHFGECLKEEESVGNVTYNMIYECLSTEGKILLIQSSDKHKFMEYTIPKTERSGSLLKLFAEEELSKLIIKNINKIHNIGELNDIRNKSFNRMRLAWYEPKYTKYEDLCSSHFPIVMRFALIYRIFPDKFNEIKDEYINIFNKVEDIKFEFNEDDFYCLFIKEKNCEWIEQIQISQGMIKSLAHLILLKTLPEGSVVLIDEFENGLGINCLDMITEKIVDTENDIQFIITSHHPYIINNIHPDYWKVVSRKCSNIITRPAKDLGIGETKHDSFFQLINVLEFEEEE